MVIGLDLKKWREVSSAEPEHCPHTPTDRWPAGSSVATGFPLPFCGIRDKQQKAGQVRPAFLNETMNDAVTSPEPDSPAPDVKLQRHNLRLQCGLPHPKP